jgi:hypothetical protein
VFLLVLKALSLEKEQLLDFMPNFSSFCNRTSKKIKERANFSVLNATQKLHE